MPESTDFSRMALALSGGGFRATLFHLGVLRYLRAANVLQSVKHIAAVSGGSILAGHVALHWNRYCGSIDEFEAASREIRDYCARDLRGSIVRRLPFLALARLLRLPRRRVPRTTTDLLIRDLNTFYRDTNLVDLEEMQPDAPRLSIVATNLTYPGLTLFESGRVVFIPLNGRHDDPAEERVYEGAAPSLALAVGASAAYPAFFTPVPLTGDDLRVSDEYGHQFHTDGGVIDNQALVALLESKLDDSVKVVISDASEADVSSRPGEDFGLIDSGFRATELMMAQIRAHRYGDMAERRPDCTFFVSIDATTEDERAAPSAVQIQLSGIRTDLDAFDMVEASELVSHGFWMAKAQLRLEHDAGFGPPQQRAATTSHIVDHLRGRFGWRLGLFTWRDPVWAVYAAILALLLLSIAPYAAGVTGSVSEFIAYAGSYDLLRRDVPAAPTVAPVAIERVADVGPRPKNVDFTVAAEHRLWDLRKLRLSGDSKQIVGSAFMTRFTELIRDHESARIYSYYFE
ncbi:MAG: patatin-like phospholipase family protein, partial [Thermoanaerobaculia bacterium]